MISKVIVKRYERKNVNEISGWESPPPSTNWYLPEPAQEEFGEAHAWANDSQDFK